MQTAVLLHWNQWDREQIGSAGNIPLEIDTHRLLCFEMVVNFVTCDTDVLVVESDEVRTYHSVLASLDGVRGSIRHHKINIIKFFPARYHSGHQSLFN